MVVKVVVQSEGRGGNDGNAATHGEGGEEGPCGIEKDRWRQRAKEKKKKKEREREREKGELSDWVGGEFWKW